MMILLHFVTALESSEDVNEKTAAFIDWAKKKADWFDPSVARTDEILVTGITRRAKSAKV